MKLGRIAMMMMALLAGAALMAGDYDQKTLDALMSKVDKRAAEAADIQAALDYVAATTAKPDGQRSALLNLYAKAAGHQAADFAAFNKLVTEKEAAMGFEKPRNDRAKAFSRDLQWRFGSAAMAEDATKAKAWAQATLDYGKTLSCWRECNLFASCCRALGNYTDAYEIYVADGKLLDQAMKVALENLGDSALALDALKALPQSTAYESNSKDAKPVIASRCINYAQKLMVSDVDADQLKDVLTKLNRKFSPKLAQDKATWEPIVAQIRLMLSAL